MANRTQETTHTRLAAEHGPTGHTQHDGDSARSAGMGMASLVAGALGVVAGIVPKLGVAALILAVVAFAAGIPSMRHGTRAAGFRYARIGVVLAVIAVLLGVLNVAIQIELFDYFTTGDTTGSDDNPL
jgi:lysylphosphatidylglycerol synthetase-like protein (DUF2156 family)